MAANLARTYAENKEARKRSFSEPSPSTSHSNRTPRLAKTRARKEIHNTFYGEDNNVPQIDGGMTTSDSSPENLPHFRQRLLSTHSAHSNTLEWDSTDVLPHPEQPCDWMNPSDWIIPESAATQLLNLSIDSPSQITDFNRVYKFDRVLEKYWSDHSPGDSHSPKGGTLVTNDTPVFRTIIIDDVDNLYKCR